MWLDQVSAIDSPAYGLICVTLILSSIYLPFALFLYYLMVTVDKDRGRNCLRSKYAKENNFLLFFLPFFLLD